MRKERRKQFQICKFEPKEAAHIQANKSSAAYQLRITQGFQRPSLYHESNLWRQKSHICTSTYWEIHYSDIKV